MARVSLPAGRSGDCCRKSRLFVVTLLYSRASFRRVVCISGQQIYADTKMHQHALWGRKCMSDSREYGSGRARLRWAA